MQRPSTIDRLGRALLALLFMGLLALGALAPHDAEAEAEGISPWQEVAEATTHPDAPAHIEAPALKTHSGCTACLFQLETQSSLVPAPLAGAVLARGEACAAAAGILPLLGPARLSAARAPPAPPLPA